MRTRLATDQTAVLRGQVGKSVKMDENIGPPLLVNVLWLDCCIMQPPKNMLTSPSLSLSFLFEEVLREYGLKVGIEEIHASLGLAVRACADRRIPNPDWWASLGTDRALIDAGRMFGLTIRDLHPGNAACALEHADAFAQHFDASYSPLIERALEHDQPVWAWCATDDVPGHPRVWRRLIARCKGGVGFKARYAVFSDSDDSAERASRLTRPPTQCYIVEKANPSAPSHDELIAGFRKCSLRMLSVSDAPDLGCEHGPASYDVWIDCLRNSIEHFDRRPHTVFASSIIESRALGLVFMDKVKEYATVEDGEMFTSLKVAFTETIAAMGSLLTTIQAQRDLARIERCVALIAHARAACKTTLAALLAREKTTALRECM